MNEFVTRRLPIDYTFVPRERTTLSSSQIHKGFAFAPLYRSVDKPGDANTFQAKARQFCAIYGLQRPMFFDNDGGNNDGGNTEDLLADGINPAARRNEIIAAMDASPKPWDVVAYFGHGLVRGLSSAGFLGQTGVRLFAEVVARNANRRIVVVLYACDTGTPGGFAQQLYHALMQRGVSATIFAHQTSQHTTNNPNKRRYPGGNYLVEPGSTYFRRWARKLRETDLWLRYPFMEPDALERAIRS